LTIAHAELHHHRIGDQTLFDQRLGLPEVSGVEHFNFRSHPELLHLTGHLGEYRRRVGHYIVPLAEVHRATVDRADLGQDLAHMVEPFGRADHVGTFLRQWQRSFDRAERDVAAHPRREVNDRIDVRGSDPVNDLCVVLDLTRRRTRDRVADVNVHYRSARLCRSNAVVGNGFGCERHFVGLSDGVAAARNSAGDEGRTHWGLVSLSQAECGGWESGWMGERLDASRRRCTVASENT
jgi:hypothetical protein